MISWIKKKQTRLKSNFELEVWENITNKTAPFNQKGEIYHCCI